MGDGQWVPFPGEAPLACTPLSAQEPPLQGAGLGPFWSPPLGTGLSRSGWLQPGLAGAVGNRACCGATKQPLSLLQMVVGRAACPPPHLPLASLDSPAPKLVFNRVNGKRPQVLPQQVSAPEECYTLAHEENVRFVYEGEGRGSLGAGTRLLSHPGAGGGEAGGHWVPPEAAASCWGPWWQEWGPQPGEAALPCTSSCSSPTAPRPGLGNPHPKSTHCLFPPHPSLAAGRAAAGRQPERGERLRPRAVRRENPQPWTQK